MSGRLLSPCVFSRRDKPCAYPRMWVCAAGVTRVWSGLAPDVCLRASPGHRHGRARW